MSNHSNDNEQRRTKTVEDTPPMRSVPMMMSVPMMPSMAPMIPLRGSTMYQKPSPSLEPYLDSKFQGSVAAAPWKVSKPLAIPSYYKLERTHIYVPNASSLKVSERIADFLRTESIAAIFDDKQALAKAETSRCLKFAVRLWEAKDQVVVEVQRTSGCCFLYQQTAKAVLCAAKYGSAHSKAPPLTIPRCVPQIPEAAWEECTADELEIACASLKKGNRMDAHLLAIESLVQLTEATKCRAFCAKNILSAGSELLSTVLSLIQSSRVEDRNSEDDEFFTDMEEEHLKIMHRHSLTILANCLQVTQQSGELTAAVQNLPELTCESTLTALVKDMSTASIKPHDAAAACRCLQALCKSEAAKQRVLQLGGAGHVSAAAHHCRHAHLEEECSILLGEL